MTQFVYYKPSGEITRRTVGLELNPESGESALAYDGNVDLSRAYVDGGVVTPMPPRPSQWHKFDYTLKEWVPDLDEAWAGVRAERNRLLAASDWTQLPDVPLETKEVWAAYRQALRAITEQPDPFNIVWPQPPG